MGEREGGRERKGDKKKSKTERKEGRKGRGRGERERDSPMQDEMGFNKESEPLGPGGPKAG